MRIFTKFLLVYKYINIIHNIIIYCLVNVRNELSSYAINSYPFHIYIIQYSNIISYRLKVIQNARNTSIM